MRGLWKYKVRLSDWIMESGSGPSHIKWDVLSAIMEFHEPILFAYWMEEK